MVKGYLPISLNIGVSGRCDIVINDEVGPLIGIRCRRWDKDEFKIETKKILTFQDQPLVIEKNNENLRFLCIYASSLRSGLVDYEYKLFPLFEGNNIRRNQVPRDVAISSSTGLFEEGIEPYHPIINEKKNGDEGAQIVKVTNGLNEYEIEDGELIRFRGSDKNVIIPEGVKKLRNGLFWDSPEIVKVEIPDSVTILGGETFSDCPNLVNLTIPRNVSAMGDNPFCNCPSLRLKNNSSNFILENGVLYNQDKSRLIYYSMNNRDSVFEIPNCVISIGKHAIHGCSELRKIIIPPSVAIMENNPFSSCPSLTLVNNSPNFTFENDALYDRKKTSLFYFAINSPLKSYVIPEGITTIQRHSFFGCINLLYVTIPRSVKVIGYNPFANCSSLSLVNNSPNFVYENGILYDRNKTTLIYYSMRNLGKELVIPDSVKVIGRNAFFGCRNLTSVIIPEGVECIDKGAFACCTALKKVEVAKSVKDVGTWAFYGCLKLSSLKMPNHTSIADHAFSRCPVKLTRF